MIKLKTKAIISSITTDELYLNFRILEIEYFICNKKCNFVYVFDITNKKELKEMDKLLNEINKNREVFIKFSIGGGHKAPYLS